MALPTIGGALPQALPCLFLNATMPKIALRQWLLLPKKIIKVINFIAKNFGQFILVIMASRWLGLMRALHLRRLNLAMQK